MLVVIRVEYMLLGTVQYTICGERTVPVHTIAPNTLIYTCTDHSGGEMDSSTLPRRNGTRHHHRPETKRIRRGIIRRV